MADHANSGSGGILVSDFRNIRSKDNPHGTLVWYCAPDQWKVENEQQVREGRDGKWYLNDDNSSFQQLVVYPPAKKDFWRKTYYEPIFAKDDGPFLYYDGKLNQNGNNNSSGRLQQQQQQQHYTIETSFTLTAVRQFDQAGICIRLGPDHWIKTGIEVVDATPRMSCVVTNVYSDWSTQAWSDFTKDEATGHVRVSASIRVHCRGTSYVVEAKRPSDDTTNPNWEFVRICHLSRNVKCEPDPCEHMVETSFRGPAPTEMGEFWAGVFTCCPEDQQGGCVTFTYFQIKEGSEFDHNADGNN